MNRRLPPALALVAVCCLAALGCQGQPARNDQGVAANAPAISGKLEAGVRIVALDPAAPDVVVRVYRGDYVQPVLATGAPLTVTVDSLKQSFTWPVPEGGKPYLKMTESGRFAFSAGDLRGTFEVVDYQASAYHEVGAAEGAKLIANVKPFVLDVRTQGEFAEGHLQGATLVPVQQLHGRLGELGAHKDEPVFVYCHSGNRSTVAAKMLVDAGFTNVTNLRRGTIEWKAAGLPLVR